MAVGLPLGLILVATPCTCVCACVCVRKHVRGYGEFSYETDEGCIRMRNG